MNPPSKPSSSPVLAKLRMSNWPNPLKWCAGILAFALTLGFGAYTFFFLFMLGSVLVAIVAQFWPLMLGAVTTITILGAAIGRKTDRGALRGAGLGALYSGLCVVLVPLIVAIVTLVNWQP